MNRTVLKGVVEMAHGAGGRTMAELIETLFVRSFANAHLDGREDQAILDIPAGRLAISTDGFVVSPLFFPGGDIGSLAVNGTINDVAVGGARPLALSVAMVLEEGLPLADLERIVTSMAEAASRAGVPVVTGDTKVVERGKGDGVFITTTGFGMVREGVSLSAANARPGDAVLVSGTLGDHGVTIMSRRAGFGVETDMHSDCAALHELIDVLLDAVPDARCLRDPTRGGLAAVLNELSEASGVGMEIEEAALPVRSEIAGACELLGLDPLYVANEGKLVAIVDGQAAETALEAMQSHPLGVDAAIIGRVTADDVGLVEMRTRFGGMRTVDWIAGEQLPRIC